MSLKYQSDEEVSVPGSNEGDQVDPFPVPVYTYIFLVSIAAVATAAATCAATLRSNGSGIT